MSASQFTMLIVGVIAAAGLTIWGLTAMGVSPVVILLLAMAGSVAVRFWFRRS